MGLFEDDDLFDSQNERDSHDTLKRFLIKQNFPILTGRIIGIEQKYYGEILYIRTNSHQVVGITIPPQSKSPYLSQPLTGYLADDPLFYNAKKVEVVIGKTFHGYDDPYYVEVYDSQ